MRRLVLGAAAAILGLAAPPGLPATAGVADFLAGRTRDCPGRDLTDADLKRFDLGCADLRVPAF